MTWARATLRRGTAAGSVWQVDANYPQARVVVGSAPNAGWVVTGPGIALFHVELYWDGNALYVADPQGVGDVRLDGKPVREWVQVQGRGQLVFGHAILELETSVAEATAMVRDPGTAPRISLVEERTRVAAPRDSIELDNESTRVAASLDEIPGSKAVVSMRPAAPPGRGPSVPPPPPNRAPQPTQPAGVPAMGPVDRPRLGGVPGGRKEARTMPGQEALPIGQEATRMIDADALAPSGAPTPHLPQRAVLGAQDGFGQQPMQPMGQPMQPMGQPMQPMGQQPMGQQPMQPMGQQPMQPMGQPMQPMGQPMQPMGDAGAMPPATGGFVPPPSFAATQQLQAQKDGSVPRRTRLMLLLFVAVVIAWLMMPTPEEEEAALRTTTATTAVPADTDAGVDAGARPFVNPSTFVPVLTTELLDGGLSRTPDSVAAQLVTDGHLEDALAQYDALRQAHPERPEYTVMAEVLRRRLMQRCTHGQRWDGTPCR